jgi:type IV pilus assembly protein PilY1
MNNMKLRIAKAFVTAAMLAGAGLAAAEDLDLFVQPNGRMDIPNVLFMIDNTANWNTPFSNEMSTLVSAFESLAVNDDGSAKFRVGVMFASETGGPNNNVGGGYVRAAIRPMDGPSSAECPTCTNSRQVYADMFANLDRQKDTGNAGKSGLQMAEAYRYFSGGIPFAGNAKEKTDYTGNVTSDWTNPSSTAGARAAAAPVVALPGNALSSKSATRYNSPIPEGYCGRNYIIYISNGANQESSADDAIANSMLAAAGGSITQIRISPTGSQSNPSDEWAKFMFESALKVTVFTLDVNRLTTGQGPGWTALLKSMAKVSEGHYYDVSSEGSDIGHALGSIFSQIQAINSVFASVSLPVSVNTEGTYLNQVYIGMFRPDRDALPRWYGNLKQYKLGLVGNQLKLLDADDDLAINPDSGFVTECARSYWTPATIDSYWSFRPRGACLDIPHSDPSNYPDGRVVEKGAAAYRLRADARTVTTCVPFSACDGDLASLATGNDAITPTLLGAADDAERNALINWANGANNRTVPGDEDEDKLSTTSIRPSVHGDVIHSRPIAINMGTDVEPKVVVFYAANDGVLRAINGNRTADHSGTPAGGELWSFMPPQFLPYVKRLRDNDVQFDYEGNPTTDPDPQPKPYGMDGPITALHGTDNNWLFTAMRRGGRALFAFDVGDMVSQDDQPTRPTLKWSIGCPTNFAEDGTFDDTGCTTDAADFGQTWSAAQMIRTQGQPPMLIMGGGYDPCEDSDPDSCTSDTKGNAVYVIDADSGEILATLPTDRAISADVVVLSDFESGIASWAYAADLGGNVYRISGATPNVPFADTPPEDWTITKVASLGCVNPQANCNGNRKFMYTPDVVSVQGTHYLLLGSGDREKPLINFSNAYDTTNYFFMVKDVPTDVEWLSSENENCNNEDVICLDSLLAITGDDTPEASDLASKKGWYLSLHDHEQVVTSSITVYGTTTFSTHTPVVPGADSCASTLGTARVYNVKFRDAGPSVGNQRSAVISGGGLPPSPVAGMVQLDNGEGTVPFCIGCDPDSPLEGSRPTPPNVGTQPKSMTYWYIVK